MSDGMVTTCMGTPLPDLGDAALDEAEAWAIRERQEAESELHGPFWRFDRERLNRASENLSAVQSERRRRAREAARIAFCANHGAPPLESQIDGLTKSGASGLHPR